MRRQTEQSIVVDGCRNCIVANDRTRRGSEILFVDEAAGDEAKSLERVRRDARRSHLHAALECQTRQKLISSSRGVRSHRPPSTGQRPSDREARDQSNRRREKLRRAGSQRGQVPRAEPRHRRSARRWRSARSRARRLRFPRQGCNRSAARQRRGRNRSFAMGLARYRRRWRSRGRQVR